MIGQNSWTSGASNFSIGRTNAPGGSINSAITFLANGNIGINSNTPSYRLDINGDLRV